MMLTRSTMDLITVRDVRVARTRADVVLGPGERPLGGGTWLYSEEQPGLTGLVDLTGLGWVPVTRTAEALVIAATCPIGTVRELDDSPLFRQCADSLLASWKVQRIATIGGNIALALPAGAMTSLAVALDAAALIWCPDGTDRRLPVAQLVLGVQRTALAGGEVVRAIEFPRSSLSARTGFRRIALSPLGRTGTLVTARLDTDGVAVFGVTGGTERPHRLAFNALPSTDELLAAIDGIDDWYDDAHGAPDWRRAMSARFAVELLDELANQGPT
jgi:CO/xanthine dehydrogenase FAD-binding subunit